MKYIKENLLRVTYTILSIIIFGVAYKYNDTIVNDSARFNIFSYAGGVATIVALMITIFEIIHSVRVSKGIQDEAKKLIEQTKRIEGASYISECLSTLDELNDHLSGERYFVSLKCFQHFRRTYVRVSGVDAKDQEIAKILGSVEFALHQATHTNTRAPLTKSKRNQIQEEILSIKTMLENINPANRGAHVS